VPDIYHDFIVVAKKASVFAAISTPRGLDEWWTKTSSGDPHVGAEYELGFGEGVDWRARVTQVVPNQTFELQLTNADPDWQDSRIRFELMDGASATAVRFRHVGWQECSEHYRVSCYCWAMYLRVLRRYVEHGERVPYEKRLDV
jgi:uncharacterized protein YndB with AHSA1/START domain